MDNDTNGSSTDPAFRDELSYVREGVRRIVAQAVEAELKGLLEDHSEAQDGVGRPAVVHNGYQPRRHVLTGVGPVTLPLPKTRGRGGEGRCSRSQLPPHSKKPRRLEAVIPWLYLKGMLTNDLDEGLDALVGESVKGLSRTTIASSSGAFHPLCYLDIAPLSC